MIPSVRNISAVVTHHFVKCTRGFTGRNNALSESFPKTEVLSVLFNNTGWMENSSTTCRGVILREKKIREKCGIQFFHPRLRFRENQI